MSSARKTDFAKVARIGAFSSKAQTFAERSQNWADRLCLTINYLIALPPGSAGTLTSHPAMAHAASSTVNPLRTPLVWRPCLMHMLPHSSIPSKYESGKGFETPSPRRFRPPVAPPHR